MIALTVNIAIFNLTRVGVLDVLFDEDNLIAQVTLEAKTNVANGDVRYAKYTIPVVNSPGLSQKVARNGAPANIFTDAISIIGAVAIANGYTALLAAWFGAANNKSARRAAAETAGLAAGWIDSSLGGVIS